MRSTTAARVAVPYLAADRDVFVEVDALVDRHGGDHPDRLLQHGVHVPD
jgi:hypothetical protein